MSRHLAHQAILAALEKRLPQVRNGQCSLNRIQVFFVVFVATLDVVLRGQPAILVSQARRYQHIGK
jgi:hypothetical protein